MGDRLSRETAEKRPMSIVVRRKRGGDHEGHHGGAWKIAYADFVTAMMAFFLLMWLLGSTSKYDKEGIEKYFNTPLSALFSGTESSPATPSSIVQGGGKNIADTRPGVGAMTQPNPPVQVTTPQLASDEMQRLQQLKQKLTSLIEHVPALNAYKDQIRISITTEGLRIEIVDSQNRPMFASGSARMQPYAVTILTQIGSALNDVENHISIAGHTDDVQYQGSEDGYTNWELSSDRANAARRALVSGGLRIEKVLQVRGLADVQPLQGNDPNAPTNRRISILVMNRAAELAFYRDGGRTATINDAASAAPALQNAVKPIAMPAPVVPVPAPQADGASNKP
ncbi:motility protein MotB [Trinickia dabaoshanensis]|uniref:Motility protein MotB n=1 Tax=Trinickia dabaoshanensis TaxID=564714 RepID=A0A2N7VZH1_9BURK|nr:flagellar motor protein MotB [Trinickia dabaoshanensis]PMS22533.1 motility protein MotB [Trinickia dabaoshanensis]